MTRDGGSLAAIFQGSNGSDYWLFFKVKLSNLPSGETERLGYSSPVVIDRLTGTEMPVSWQHAIALLHQMTPFLFEARDRKWLRAMETTAEGLGRSPPEIDRIFGA